MHTHVMNAGTLWIRTWRTRIHAYAHTMHMNISLEVEAAGGNWLSRELSPVAGKPHPFPTGVPHYHTPCLLYVMTPNDT